ncbi:putative asparaginase [Skeletonema marinoi]|uniref:Asparaginase n=1 Tax=Skeletonema marinoi TaxID=267567 RepID=A0AAD8Y152_9STRA|nr:putative asparaginase [Skeletonema marinoi]
MLSSISGGAAISRPYEDPVGDDCRVYVFTLGGTIDKDYPKLTSGYAFEFGDESAAQRILETHPNLGISYKIKSICKKDSLEIAPNDRDNLCLEIENMIEMRRYHLESLLRIVVTHGTDTMIETAMYIKNKIKAKNWGLTPHFVIAFTGATKPERFVDSDASFNVGCAVAATSCPCEPWSVVICMNGNVIPVEQCVRDEASGLFMKVVVKK